MERKAGRSQGTKTHKVANPKGSQNRAFKPTHQKKVDNNSLILANGGGKKEKPIQEDAAAEARPANAGKEAEVVVAAAAGEEEEEEDLTCLLCCEPITFFSVGDCEHSFICALCTLRRRGLYKDWICCICKQELRQILFTENRSRTPMEALALSSGLFYDPLSRCHFEDREHYLEACKLWQFSCPVCDANCERPLSSLANLKKHLAKVHSLSYCELCLEHRKIFLKEQKAYTATALAKHEYGEGEKELDQHQWCEFCERLFFDKDDIFQHLMKQHYTCHICEKNGIKYHYFKNYKTLERHFRQQHFLCEERTCLNEKFIVFATALDLRAHDLKCHAQERGLTRAEIKQAQKLEIGMFLEKPVPSERRGRSREDPVMVFNPMLSHPPPRTSTSTAFTGPTPAAAAGATQSGGREKKTERKPQYVEKEPKSNGERKATREAPNAESGVRFPPEPVTEEERRERNLSLVAKIRAAIGEEEFPNFKKMSADLRTAHLTPAQYYQKYWHLFDLDQGLLLFPELVSLLPDPVLRSALAILHRQAVAEGMAVAKRPRQPPAPPPQDAPTTTQIQCVAKTGPTGRGEREGGKPPQSTTAKKPNGVWNLNPPPSREDFPSLPTSNNALSKDAELARQLAQQPQGKKGTGKKGKKGQVLLRFG